MVEKKKGGATRKSGGSQASNAVVGGITNAAFKRMNSTAQNMGAVGGSVASNAVTSLPSAEVYKALNSLFTNGVSSSKTGGSCSLKSKQKQKGGFFNNVLGQTTMQVFKNNVRSFAGNSASPYPFNSAAVSTKWNSNVRGNNNTPPTPSNVKAPNTKVLNTKVINTKAPNTKVINANVNVVKQVAGSTRKRGGSSVTNSRLVMNSAGLYPFSDDPLNNPLKNYAIKNNTTTTATKVGGKYSKYKKHRGGVSNNIHIDPILTFNQYSKNLQEHSPTETAVANKILASEYIDSFGYIDKSSMYGSVDNTSRFSYGQTALQGRPVSIGTSSGNKVNTLSGGSRKSK